MDRASDSGSEGWGFESLPVYQKFQMFLWGIWNFLCPEAGLERALRKHAGGMFLACGRVLGVGDASSTDVDTT